MFKKLALLAAALTLTMPVFAEGMDTSPSASAPAATSDAKPAKKHHKKGHGHHKHKKMDDTAAK